MSSRRLTSALAAGMLATGILAGVTLGPAPASSPADSSTLAQRTIATLVAQTGSASISSPPIGSGATSGESEAKTTATSHVAKKSNAASDEASATVPSEGSSEETSAGIRSPGSSPEHAPSQGSGKGKETGLGGPVKLPPIKHVWLIAVSGEGFARALAKSQGDSYLAKQLIPKGTLLSGYTLSAGNALANGVALLSGQGLNLDTEQDCPTYADLQPATVNAASGLAEGIGCVYPAAIKTLPDELTAAGLTWKAYVQGMETGRPSASEPAEVATGPTPGLAAPGKGTSVTTDGGPPPPGADTTAPGPTSTAAPAVSCRHPELGAPDPNHAPVIGDPYLTFRNPFVYFHSLLDSGACASDDVDLSRLPGDLATSASTPNLSWIVPSACDDGSSAPCAPGAPAGLAPLDGFLQEIVPKILATAAYRKDGLIEIVPDRPASSTNAAKPVGALLISPFVHAKAHVAEAFNDFSLSKSLARLFGVLPLGHSGDPSAVSFGATVYRTTKQ